MPPQKPPRKINGTLTEDDIIELRAKICNPLNLKQFEKKLSHYVNRKSWLKVKREELDTSIYLNKTSPFIGQLKEEIRETIDDVREFEIQEKDNRKDLKTIAKQNSYVHPIFHLPKKYGKNNDPNELVLGNNIPVFNPKNKDHKFSLTWFCLKKHARRNDWSKGIIKAMLHECLRGKAIDCFRKYQARDLGTIVAILAKKFEVVKKCRLAAALNNFERKAGESLSNCITRLQYSVNCVHSEDPEPLQADLKEASLELGLKKLVPLDLEERFKISAYLWRYMIQIPEQERKDLEFFD